MAELDTFREETRDWLEANCPAEMRQPIRSEDDVYWGGRNATFASDAQRQWFEACRDKGYTVPDWPKAYGGAGLSVPEAKVLKQEMARIGARSPLNSFGIWMLGPALLKFGTEEQKVHYLGQVARGEIRWCQGYSEPGSGSDLVSLQTYGEDKGDHWEVSGQKVWTQLRRQVRLDLLPGPHGQGEQVPGHHLHAVRHGVGRGEHEADQADQRQLALLRDLHGQGGGPQGSAGGRGQPRLGRGQVPVGARSAR